MSNPSFDALNSCSSVVSPSSQSLHPIQQFGLELIAWGEGRDVVFAIDVTRSVQLNNEGRLRVEQMIRNSLNIGDTAYIVPFASHIQQVESIEITSQKKIPQLLNKLPLKTNFNQSYTDIQNTELWVYQFLAQKNHCRLLQNQGIREQAVVWLTDAPLATQQPWIETPQDSPFLDPDSKESQLRREWLEALPRETRSRDIPTKNDEPYQLTIVDVQPTVQEFCTPAPSGQETCFVNRYLLQQLWFPTTGLILILISGVTLLGLWSSWQKPWQITIETEGEDEEDNLVKSLKRNQRLAIGDFDASAIDYIECPGEEVRGYLERKRNNIYIVPTQLAPIFYKDKEIKTRMKISGNRFRLNCPKNNQKDFEFIVKIDK